MTARVWPMYAGQRLRRDGSPEFCDFYDHPMTVEMCGHSEVHAVLLIEDVEGPLLGWIEANRPDEIVMIQHHVIFNIQFPYGVQAEIDRERGEVVPLRAEAAPTTQQEN